MAGFAGQVLLDEGQVEVVIDLTDDAISLIAAGNEVGTWPISECQVRPAGDGRYSISAENDTIAFLPDDPKAFDKSLNGAAPRAERVRGKHLDRSLHQGPPPTNLTLFGFYLLAAVTGGLGLWALVSLLS